MILEYEEECRGIHKKTSSVSVPPGGTPHVIEGGGRSYSDFLAEFSFI